MLKELAEYLGKVALFFLALIAVMCVLAGIVSCEMGPAPEPQPTACRLTLEESLAEHYIIGEAARRYASSGRITINCMATNSDADLQLLLCPGDVIEITLEHPPINPDGTPANAKRYWLITNAVQDRSPICDCERCLCRPTCVCGTVPEVKR